MFHLDVRESGANVGYRIREGIKGLVHKEIERRREWRKDDRKDREKKGVWVGWEVQSRQSKKMAQGS